MIDVKSKNLLEQPQISRAKIVHMILNQTEDLRESRVQLKTARICDTSTDADRLANQQKMFENHHKLISKTKQSTRGS